MSSRKTQTVGSRRLTRGRSDVWKNDITSKKTNTIPTHLPPVNNVAKGLFYRLFPRTSSHDFDDHSCTKNISIESGETKRQDFINLKVTGYSIGALDDIVRYNIDVTGPGGPLSTYTIRRRFGDFHILHKTVSELMANDLENTSVLPSMPSSGWYTYLKRHDLNLMERRKKEFQFILNVLLRYIPCRTNTIVAQFFSFAPSYINSTRGISYVSLKDYGMPTMDLNNTIREKKKQYLLLKSASMSA